LINDFDELDEKGIPCSFCVEEEKENFKF